MSLTLSCPRRLYIVQNMHFTEQIICLAIHYHKTFKMSAKLPRDFLQGFHLISMKYRWDFCETITKLNYPNVTGYYPYVLPVWCVILTQKLNIHKPTGNIITPKSDWIATTTTKQTRTHTHTHTYSTFTTPIQEIIMCSTLKNVMNIIPSIPRHSYCS